MILTPIPPEDLPAALARFAGALADGPARRAFAAIAATASDRAGGSLAEIHRQQALDLARRFDMGVMEGAPSAGFSWDGYGLRAETEAYVLLHEVAHWQLASPARRRVLDFGLGAGPETGCREAAERAARLFGVAREREEAMASLLGILWEVALGQPALASFLDQNWLEGAGSAGAARHFTGVLSMLRGAGFLGPGGQPTMQLRMASDDEIVDLELAG